FVCCKSIQIRQSQLTGRTVCFKEDEQGFLSGLIAAQGTQTVTLRCCWRHGKKIFSPAGDYNCVRTRYSGRLRLHPTSHVETGPGMCAAAGGKQPNPDCRQTRLAHL